MFRKKSSDNNSPRSPRQLRVGEELRHALAASLQKGDFPWEAEGPRPLITVTEVRIGPDLRNATIYVMPLGGVRIEAVIKELNRNKHFFKNVIAKNVHMRWIPQLHFSSDTSFDYAAKIDKILHDPAVARDLKDKEDEE
jgi:ribosome-binding factor A